jgi:hypothetical protein
MHTVGPGAKDAARKRNNKYLHIHASTQSQKESKDPVPRTRKFRAKGCPTPPQIIGGTNQGRRTSPKHPATLPEQPGLLIPYLWRRRILHSKARRLPRASGITRVRVESGGASHKPQPPSGQAQVRGHKRPGGSTTRTREGRKRWCHQQRRSRERKLRRAGGGRRRGPRRKIRRGS